MNVDESVAEEPICALLSINGTMVTPAKVALTPASAKRSSATKKTRSELYQFCASQFR